MPSVAVQHDADVCVCVITSIYLTICLHMDKSSPRQLRCGPDGASAGLHGASLQ